MSLSTLPRRVLTSYQRHGLLATLTRGFRKLRTVASGWVEKVQARFPCSVRSIAAKHDLSPSFVAALLNNYKVTIAPRETFDAFMAHFDPMTQLHVSFALTTSLRGRTVYDKLAPLLPAAGAGRRYLDIGCAYGGFLRAFHAQGYHTHGVEILPNLYELGKLNCQGLPHNQIWHGDFLSMAFADMPGFDVITCNDVIEHVQDARAAMEKMATLINPGGLLYMEIPNKDCIPFVREDGHFLLFGINLLEHNDAATLFETMTGTGYDRAGMGEFYPLAFYTGTFARLGLQVEILPSFTFSMADVDRLLSELDAAYDTWQAQHGATGTIGPLVCAKYQQYRDELCAARLQLTDDAAVTAFTRRYLTQFWSVVVRKG